MTDPPQNYFFVCAKNQFYVTSAVQVQILLMEMTITSSFALVFCGLCLLGFFVVSTNAVWTVGVKLVLSTHLQWYKEGISHIQRCLF